MGLGRASLSMAPHLRVSFEWRPQSGETFSETFSFTVHTASLRLSVCFFFPLDSPFVSCDLPDDMKTNFTFPALSFRLLHSDSFFSNGTCQRGLCSDLLFLGVSHSASSLQTPSNGEHTALLLPLFPFSIQANKLVLKSWQFSSKGQYKEKRGKRIVV